jgi:hypothetical protein
LPSLSFNTIEGQSAPQNSFVSNKVVVSIATAPTNHPPDWSGLSKNARGQKGADKPDDPVRAGILSGTSDSRILSDLGFSIAQPSGRIYPRSGASGRALAGHCVPIRRRLIFFGTLALAQCRSAMSEDLLESQFRAPEAFICSLLFSECSEKLCRLSHRDPNPTRAVQIRSLRVQNQPGWTRGNRECVFA